MIKMFNQPFAVSEISNIEQKTFNITKGQMRFETALQKKKRAEVKMTMNECEQRKFKLSRNMYAENIVWI